MNRISSTYRLSASWLCIFAAAITLNVVAQNQPQGGRRKAKPVDTTASAVPVSREYAVSQDVTPLSYPSQSWGWSIVGTGGTSASAVGIAVRSLYLQLDILIPYSNPFDDSSPSPDPQYNPIKVSGFGFGIGLVVPVGRWSVTGGVDHVSYRAEYPQTVWHKVFFDMPNIRTERRTGWFLGTRYHFSSDPGQGAVKGLFLGAGYGTERGLYGSLGFLF
ncbi:MAG: hypothetical protein HY962_14145 [Ignavibacteriae bacterium]|nr:hypothetical protein [Ignavibacteriota bacterium]